jgi:hypothetical protein
MMAANAQSIAIGDHCREAVDIGENWPVRLYQAFRHVFSP